MTMTNKYPAIFKKTELVYHLMTYLWENKHNICTMCTNQSSSQLRTSHREESVVPQFHSSIAVPNNAGELQTHTVTE